MKKTLLSVFLLLALLLCGCVGEEVGRESESLAQSESVELVSDTETAAETIPEIPNTPDDGYSKRY